MTKPSLFQSFFDVAVASSPPETPRDVARYWAQRRGRGEPSDAEVAREMAWETLCRAQECDEPVDVQLSLEPEGWVANVDGVRASVPERCAVLADPPLAPGVRRMKVMRFDRVLETIELRPMLRGEPVTARGS